MIRPDTIRTIALDERPERIIAAVRARGSDATDLRDAAHEAHHALTAGLRKKWDRESIDRAICRKFQRPGAAASEEILARAVEQLVCADLGVDCGTIDHWAFICCMEAAKFGQPFMRPTEAKEAIERRMKSKEARAAADKVIALGGAA